MTALLQINSVSKEFSGLRVLVGIDLSVEQGERHAIIGPNGAGKSTLFNVITGKHRVSNGQVLFNGRDITNWPPHRVSRVGLARSFQVTNIFPNMTVYENIRNVIVSKNGMRFNMVSGLGKIHRVEAETRQVLKTIRLESSADTPAGELAYGHQRALIVFREGQRTVALLSGGVAGRASAVERDPELPAFEGAIHLSRVDGWDGGIRSSTYSYVVKQRRAEHEQFLVTAFRALGWQGGRARAAKGVRADQLPLLFGREQRMCRVFLASPR